MKRSIKAALAAAMPLLAAVACTDFLTGGELDNDPNRPVDVSTENLFNGVQATTFLVWNADIARTTSMWMQQMAGTGQQYLSQGRYDIDEGTFDTDFELMYASGGLIDIRRAKELAKASNDSLYVGILQVYEAFNIGMAASIWGDIPYSQAGNIEEFPTPELDPQEEVYASVQAVLDSAIVNLAGGGGGPLNDLNFAGDGEAWTEVAHTLKARFYLHWVEAQQAGVASHAVACGGAGTCITKAHANALLGISSADNDFKSRHTSLTGEENVWYQFIDVQRPGYINAGKYLVDLLVARNDPRLEEYFESGEGGEFVGALSGQSVSGEFAQVNEATRRDPAFNQPMVTFDENRLILAETEFYLGGAANVTAAQGRVNAVRSDAGYTTVLPATTTGAPLLEAIITEKYIALFQNPEVWNDYKRTCLPRIPIRGLSGVTQIPGRFFYAVSERNTNSENIPSVSEQQANNRNENDPNACAFIAP